MPIFKADLHNHTVLSPCGDIEMTPSFIIDNALEHSYDIIGITDHNTTLQANELKRISKEFPLFILTGVEITTIEEVHCLAFVDGDEALQRLEDYIKTYLPKIKNDVDLFGYQLLVNKEEEVLYEEDILLISAINQNINQVEQFVHSLGGIFIPAHIDKKQNSIISQLGFIPFDLKIDALEFSANCDISLFLEKNKYISKFKTSYIRSSDAHYPMDYLKCETLFYLEELSFAEIKMAFEQKNGRYIVEV